ncbi:MAG: FGGY-family carbohydrate kinase [Microbacterium sp.]
MADSGRPLVVAVDQGTSATKALLVDGEGDVVARASRGLGQSHPRPGWVEQDAGELLESVRAAIAEVRSPVESTIAGIGISAQRESAVAWDPATGRPLSPVIGWQDRRTVATARSLDEHAARVREITGLPLDPMFSALKLSWILDDIDPDRSLARSGRLALGTVDAWLLWNLTGEHRIEAGSASRTQLLDLATGDWSAELLELFRIPREALPDVRDSDAPGEAMGLRLGAVLGDSHAALYGHGARETGDVKVTYGTGSSVMGLTDRPVVGPGLVGTIAWRANGATARAFEGNILSTGATVRWLADVLGVTADELAALAQSVEDSGGVDIVPAFAGLGAPWWDERAVAIASGLQLGTGRGHLARAAFESIVLQIEDVLRAAEQETGLHLGRLLADGGPSRNSWLMQLQADLSGRDVHRHDGADLSALGAAAMAAETIGIRDRQALDPSTHSVFAASPDIDAAVRRERWSDAMARARLRDD